MWRRRGHWRADRFIRADVLGEARRRLAARG